MTDVVTIPGWHLHEMLRTVAFASLDGHHDKLPCFLHAVHLWATAAGRLHAAATDNHRLAYTSRPAGVPGRGMARIGIESDRVTDLYEACATGDRLTLRALNDALIVEGGTAGALRFEVQTAEQGKGFPVDYQARAPRSWAATIQVEAAPLLRTVYSLMMLPGEYTTLRLRRLNDQLALGTQSTARILTRVPHLLARWDVEELPDRGVSGPYLADAVAAAVGREVELRIPAAIDEPIGVFSPADPDWTCAIMPVALDSTAATVSGHSLH